MKPPPYLRDVPPTVPAKGFQGRAVGAVLGRIVAPTLKKRGFREIDILAHWPMIVGPQLAALSCPERISRSGRGTEGGAVSRLNIVQGPLPLDYLKAQAARETPLSETELADAEAALDGFNNSRLKQALARLGARMARRRDR